jgi:hypothetical protein
MSRARAILSPMQKTGTSADSCATQVEVPESYSFPYDDETPDSEQFRRRSHLSELDLSQGSSQTTLVAQPPPRAPPRE